MRDTMRAIRVEKALERIIAATQALGDRFGCADKAAEIALVSGKEPIRSMKRMEVIAEVLEVLVAEAEWSDAHPSKDEAQTDTDEGDTDNAPATPAVTKAKAAKAKAK